MTHARLAIIADDLTGAMDSSGYLAAQGLSASVVLESDSPPETDVVAVTTDSRLDLASVAAEKARLASRAVSPRTVYKKIDSTLRGNIGPELEAVMDELGYSKAIVAPAFPSADRTTVDGTLLLDGVRITETAFARDPTSPVTESNLPTLLEASMELTVGHVGLDIIASRNDGISHHLKGRSERVLVCDAAEQDHLRAIAHAVAAAEERWLLCGSGGLARELGILLPERSKRDAVESLARRTGPALLVVGSMHPGSSAQLREVQSGKGIPLLRSGIENVDEVVRRAGSVAVTSAFDPYVPGQEAAVADALVAATVRAVGGGLAGLLLCGGEIAVQVCARLGVRAIRLVGEVEAGVPAGVVSGGDADGVRVVTKAGGIGSPKAMLAALSYLEDGVLPEDGLLGTWIQ